MRRLSVLPLIILFGCGLNHPKQLKRKFCGFSSDSIISSFGDSITKGGAVERPYPTLIAEALGISTHNYGINGAQAADIAPDIYGTQVNPDAISTLAIGINDMRTSHGDEEKLEWFKKIHSALVVWLATPNKKFAHDVSFSPDWSFSNHHGSFDSMVSSTNGGTAEFDISGSVVYIGLTASEFSMGKVKVEIDGMDKGDYSVAGEGKITTFQGKKIAPFLIRFSNLRNKVHNVKLTVVSPTDIGNKVYFDWAAGVEKGPHIFVGGTTNMSAEAYVTYGGSDSLSEQFHNVILENIIQLSNDGLCAYFVDYRSYIELSDLADGLHPTQAGYEKIAERFLFVMRSALSSI